MVYYNHSCLMILVNDTRYIHCLPIFSTSLSPFTLQVWAIYKINRILHISPQMLLTSFVRNIIIDVSYNLSKYMQCKHVLKTFWRSLFTSTHYNYLVMLWWKRKSCSEISKTLYWNVEEAVHKRSIEYFFWQILPCSQESSWFGVLFFKKNLHA